jgi:solute carrier family 25 S-adenosylmethionine transporter 26
MQFGDFEKCRDYIGTSLPLFASAAGAACSCIISVPQEVIKQRLVTGVCQSLERLSAPSMQRMVLWVFTILLGNPPWRETWLPFVMTTFLTMDFMKSRRLEQRNHHGRDGSTTQLSVRENVLLGVTSALVLFGIVTNPADAIKTRMMTQFASTQIPYTLAFDLF